LFDPIIITGTTGEWESHHSVPYQEDAIQRFCEHKGYNIIATYKESYSAKTLSKRPEWNKIITFIKPNKLLVQKVICLRHDRFSRSFANATNEIIWLNKLGCDIEMVESNVEMSSPEAMLTRNIMLILPEIENAKISIRSREDSHKASKSGCFTGPAPRGYKNVRIGTQSSLEFSGEAPLIRESFEKMASGTYSAGKVRRWLNSVGIEITKNTYLNTVRNIITYTGKIFVKEFLGESSQTVLGLHPPLIMDEVFAAANDVLKGRRRNMKFKDDKSDLYLLKGHLICPIHGRTLSSYG